MKKYMWIMSLLAAVIMASCQNAEQPFNKEQRVAFAKKYLDLSMTQTANFIPALKDTALFPRTVEKGELRLVPPQDWTSGFFPGQLWMYYEYSKDDKWKNEAIKFTRHMAPIQFHHGTHDLGFMMYCSYGNGLRLTADSSYRTALINTAATLATRFRTETGCIKSWDWSEKWQFPVIVDNMMNLELLFWASKHTGDPRYYQIAVTHANTTLKNHYRDNYSCYHVVEYDTLNGNVLWRGTHQGAADESEWARGQAWGLYGYTLSYRETKDPAYLAQAQAIASYIMNHKNLPLDKVPYWDFLAPGIPQTERDASAAAIIASALLELMNYVDAEQAKTYYNFAEAQLRALASPTYLAEPGTNGFFLLKHCVGNKPGNSEIDVPINYADYYFVEALIRLSRVNL